MIADLSDGQIVGLQDRCALQEEISSLNPLQQTQRRIRRYFRLGNHAYSLRDIRGGIPWPDQIVGG